MGTQGGCFGRQRDGRLRGEGGAMIEALESRCLLSGVPIAAMTVNVVPVRTTISIAGAFIFSTPATTNPTDVPLDDSANNSAANASISVQTSADTITAGESVGLTATVTPVSADLGVPSGTVTFSIDSIRPFMDYVVPYHLPKELGTAPLVNGVASLNCEHLGDGRYTIIATYEGDGTFVVNNTQLATLTVRGIPSLHVQSWGRATKTHSPVLTATATFSSGRSISGVEPTPTIPGSIQSATTSLTNDMPAVLVVAPSYAWFYGYSGGASTVSGCTILTAASGFNWDFGSLTPWGYFDRPTVPAGNVTFMDGLKVLGTAPLDSNGTATFTPAAGKLGLGSHNITAVFDGDGNFAAAQSPVEQVPVTLAPTTIALASSKSVMTSGESITFGITVSTKDADFVAPTGRVTLKDGKQILATLKLGDASRKIAVRLPLGIHRITAIYAGDKNCRPSRSAASVLTVKAKTETTLAAPATVLAGQRFKIGAFVATEEDAPTPTGTVTFYARQWKPSTAAGYVTLGTARLIDGAAEITVTGWSPSQYRIIAHYDGDARSLASDASIITIKSQTAGSNSAKSRPSR